MYPSKLLCIPPGYVAGGHVGGTAMPSEKYFIGSTVEKKQLQRWLSSGKVKSFGKDKRGRHWYFFPDREGDPPSGVFQDKQLKGVTHG